VGLLPEEPSTRALLSLVLLVLGTAACLYALRHRRAEVPAAATATAGVVGWLLTGTGDTPRLLVLVEGNGIHAGDLLTVPAGLLVLWLCVRGVRG